MKSLFLVLGAVCCALSAARPLGAQGVFAGGEFVVNTTTAGDQTSPRVSYAASGFVIVWESGGDIRARMFNPRGQALGADFRVNTFTTGFQNAPAVADYGSGEFLVVWASADQDGDSSGIYGQRYSGAGVPEGGAFRVNTETTGGQSSPAVSGSGGGIFVTWESTQEGLGSGIYGQRYLTTGPPTGTEFHVNAYTTGFQFSPAISNDLNASFTIVFEGAGTPADDDGFGIFAQRYAAGGAKSGGEFRANTTTTGTQNHPQVTQQNNSIDVVWDTPGSSGFTEIHAQRYAGALGGSPGPPLGGEFRVNTYTSAHASYPRISSDPQTEEFFVTWQSGHDGSGLGVFAQKLTASGTPSGPELQVNTFTTGDQTHPDVLGGRDLVATWQSPNRDGSGTAIVMRRACFILTGDANNDGHVDVLDVFYLINHLYAGGAPPVKGSDVNADGTLDVLDVFYLINYLFAGASGPACG